MRTRHITSRSITGHRQFRSNKLRTFLLCKCVLLLKVNLKPILKIAGDPIPNLFQQRPHLFRSAKWFVAVFPILRKIKGINDFECQTFFRETRAPPSPPGVWFCKLFIPLIQKDNILCNVHLVAVVEAVKVTIGSLKHRHAINLLIKVYPLAWNDDLDVFEQLAQVLCCEGRYRHDHDEWLVQLFETSENLLLLAEWWIGYNDVSLVLECPRKNGKSGWYMATDDGEVSTSVGYIRPLMVLVFNPSKSQ